MPTVNYLMGDGYDIMAKMPVSIGGQAKGLHKASGLE